MKRIIQLLLVLLPIGALAQSNSSMNVECGDESIYVLTATPEDGFHFVKWADDATAPNPREVQVLDNITYTAVFAENDAPVVIENGQKKNLSELDYSGSGSIYEITIEPGGELTIDDPSKTITKLFIETTGTQSGQVHGISTIAAAATANMEVYLDYRLNPTGDAANDQQWYGFAVPFTVSIQNGIFHKGNTTPLVSGVNFLIYAYDSNKRAQTGNGWVPLASTDHLNPGQFYLMTIDGTENHWLFKKEAGTTIPTENTVGLVYCGNGDSNSGINGIANPTLEYTPASLNENVYVCFFNNEDGAFEDPVLLSDASFVVGKPFLIQILPTTDLSIGFPSYTPSSGAPRRASMDKDPLMRMTLTNTQNAAAGHMYLSMHADGQSNHYVIGRDFARMDNKNTRPHVWCEAYGLQLAAHGVQTPNTTTEMPFVLSTPVAGTFRLDMNAKAMDEYMVELLYNGEYIANLSDEEPYSLELKKGTTYGYSLRLRAMMPTDIKAVQGEEETSAKILLNHQLYIRHGEHVYDAQGRKIK